MRARCLDYVSIYIPKKIYSLYTTVHEYITAPEAIKRQLSVSEEVWGESTADPKTNLTKILDFHRSFFV